MNDITLEQKKQLNSWASQRDAILVDISNKRIESENLTKINKDLAASNTDISNRIQQSIGRLEELNKKDNERATLITSENAVLIAQRSMLETVVSSFKSEIIDLLNTKTKLVADIEYLTKIHDAVFSRVGEIEKIVSATVTLNSTNAREVVNILAQAGIELKKIIDIGSENVAMTTRLVAEIPKVIVDIHRDVLERKKAPRAKI